jgi:hypothetical protein
MMPPSPRLSARRISSTYFSVTTSIRPQKMTDTAPIRCVASRGMPVAGLKTSFMVYSGLVPMSPYTTPIAPRARAAKLSRLAVLLMSIRGGGTGRHCRAGPIRNA